MSGPRTSPRTSPSAWAAAALAALLLAAGPIACGKRGALEVPEGQESEYTYPRAYPSPRSVVPETAETEKKTAGEAAGDGFILGPANTKLSPYPNSRTRTKTYGPVISE